MEARWSEALSGCPVVVINSVVNARLIVAEHLGIGPDSWLGVPLNASRTLLHTLDRTGAIQHFGTAAYSDFVWAESRGGVVSIPTFDDSPYVLDCAETLPDPVQSNSPDGECLVSLFGLHLSHDKASDGALLVFNPDMPDSMALFERIKRDLAGEELLVGAADQLERLTGPDGLARRQHDVLQAIRSGIEQAAGLVVVEPLPNALSPGVVFEIPVETDPWTFAVYARAEKTPFTSLLEYAPPGYRFMRQRQEYRDAVALARLQRYALVPCGPGFSDEEIGHAVLGPVKAAEYSGVRWISDPERASWYAGELDGKYGAGHDAYRPAFDPRNRDQSSTAGADGSAGDDLRVTLSRSELRLEEQKAKP